MSDSLNTNGQQMSTFDHDFETLFGETDFDFLNTYSNSNNVSSMSIEKCKETISGDENLGGIFRNVDFDFDFSVPSQQPPSLESDSFDEMFTNLINTSLLPNPTTPFLPSSQYETTSSSQQGTDSLNLFNHSGSESGRGSSLPGLSSGSVWNTPLDELLSTPSQDQLGNNNNLARSVLTLDKSWNLFPSMEVKDQQPITELDNIFSCLPPTALMMGGHSGETTVENSPTNSITFLSPLIIQNISPTGRSLHNVSPPSGTFNSEIPLTPRTPSVSASPVQSKARKNRKTIELSAPTQRRNYVVPSATSKRDLPVFINKDLLRAGYAPDEIEKIRLKGEEGVEMLGEDVKKIIDKKRVQNTMSARRARVRRENKVKDLEERRDGLKAEIEGYRQRVRESRRFLQIVGMSEEFLNEHPAMDEDDSGGGG